MVMFLAQMAEKSQLPSELPRIQTEETATFTWIIAVVLLVGILLITFKTSKRNAILDSDLK